MNDQAVIDVKAEDAPAPNTTAVAVRPKMEVGSPMDVSTADFSAALDRRKANRKVLMDWIREALVDGVDFGSVKTKHGPSKPSLRKPGAEKICGMLNVTPTFPTLPDYEKAALGGIRIESIILRCELIAANGATVAHGVGARSVSDDDGDLNKALKMAEKSAHIDATLRMAGLSELFTQDIEDMKNKDAAAPRTTPAAPASAPNPAKPWDMNRFEAYCLARLVKHAEANWGWWKYAVDRAWILPTETIDALAVPGHLCSDNIFGLDAALTPEENRNRAANAFKAHETAVGAMLSNIDPGEADLVKAAYKTVHATPAGPAASAATPPPAAKPTPAPAPQAPARPNNPYGCPQCRSSATKTSQDYEAVMWCESCGWQWDSAGKPFESHPWLSVICPIAKKGTPKFTLGQISRTEPKRFYGIVMNNSEEKARAGREWKGKHYQPSKEDIIFGAACDQARAYMEQGKEQGGGQQQQQPPAAEDDVPF